MMSPTGSFDHAGDMGGELLEGLGGQQVNGEEDNGFLKQITSSSDDSTASTTHSLEELSSPEFFKHQCAEIDAMASRVVESDSVKRAIQAVLDDVKFCVTIADPLADDCPLIAVSDEFEHITGFQREEVLGKNCRFLNNGCQLDPVDLVRLRSCIKTGACFTSVLTNRRKSGELFLNLLDLRGLTVARNPATEKELWFLVGIQADVSDVASDLMEANLEEVHALASHVRNKLAAELSAMAVAGALRSDISIVDHSNPVPDAWCLLPNSRWREGTGSSAKSDSSSDSGLSPPASVRDVPGYFLGQSSLRHLQRQLEAKRQESPRDVLGSVMMSQRSEPEPVYHSAMSTKRSDIVVGVQPSAGDSSGWCDYDKGQHGFPEVKTAAMTFVFLISFGGWLCARWGRPHV